MQSETDVNKGCRGWMGWDWISPGGAILRAPSVLIMLALVLLMIITPVSVLLSVLLSISTSISTTVSVL